MMTEKKTSVEKLNQDLNRERAIRISVERKAAQYEEAEIERLFWKDLAQEQHQQQGSGKDNVEILEAIRRVRDISSRIEDYTDEINRRDDQIETLLKKLKNSPQQKSSKMVDLIYDLQTDLPGLDNDLTRNWGNTQTNKELQDKLSKLRAEVEKRRQTTKGLRDEIDILRVHKRDSIPREVYNQKLEKLNQEIDRRRNYGKRLEKEISDIKNKKASKQVKGMISRDVYNQHITKLKADIDRRLSYRQRLESELEKRKNTIKTLRNMSAVKTGATINTFNSQPLHPEAFAALSESDPHHALLMENERLKLKIDKISKEKDAMVPRKVFDEKIEELKGTIQQHISDNKRVEDDLKKRKETIELLQNKAASSNKTLSFEDRNAADNTQVPNDMLDADSIQALSTENERLKSNNKKYLDELARQRDTIRWLRGEE